MAFVITQWLLLLQQTSPHYLNIPDMISNPSRWQEMNNLMCQANEHIINVADQVTREEDILAEDGLGADIAETSRVSLGHRTAQDEHVPLFGDTDPPFAAVDTSFPLRCSLVTDRNITHDYNASSEVQLSALAKEFLPSVTDYEKTR